MKYRTHLCQGIIKALSCDTLLVMMLSLEVSNIIHSHLCQVFFPPFFYIIIKINFVLLKEANKNFGWNCETIKIFEHVTLLHGIK
jgi:hypothetical protein